MSVRVRYAPSPTGLQHIGGLRTALFNYLHARSRGGTFILRIEDTDRSRYDERSLHDLYAMLDWLGISWDEGPGVGGDYGPYIQSQRIDIYRRYAEQLLAEGKAYYAYDTPERLEELRRQRQDAGESQQGYDRLFRDMGDDELRGYREQGIEPVIRFRAPLSGSVTVHDVILGDVSRDAADLIADPVLVKSDGFPTYHFAHVVDDHLMEITHVMRAQEWVPSAPMHVLLFEAFGWTPPMYCHLPMVLGEDGKKLSKRHGATSVVDFRTGGYMPEAITNYVALLGWAYDDTRELFSLDELEDAFSIDRLNKAPATFDYRKLEWFNGHYIREASDSTLAERISPYLVQEGAVDDPPTAAQAAMIVRALPLVRDRLKLLTDAPAWMRFLFVDELAYDRQTLIPKKSTADEARRMLHIADEELAALLDADDEAADTRLREIAAEAGVKLGTLLMPLRIALTGSSASPPLLGSARLLGVDRCKARIAAAIAKLSDEP